MTGIGWGELVILLVIGLFVFGPEKLPKVVADVVRTVRSLRAQASTLTDQVKTDFAAHVDVDELRRLDPRRGLTDEDDSEPTSPKSRPDPAGTEAAAVPAASAADSTTAGRPDGTSRSAAADGGPSRQDPGQ